MKKLAPPPKIDEASNNLNHPEHAPLSLDRRTLRQANRTIQLNVRVPETFRNELDHITQLDRLSLWQWLAVSMEAYKALPEKEKSSLIRQVISQDAAMQQYPNRHGHGN